jgi:YggT family protein
VSLICTALQIYVIVIFARVILTWFPISPESAVASIDNLLRRATDPVLEPIRRMLPAARMGGLAFDFSPLIVIVVIYFVLVPLFC